MHQPELFPDKKIFSNTVISYWLCALTGAFLIFFLFYFIGAIIFPSKNISSAEIAKLKEEIFQLNEKVTALEQKIDEKASTVSFKSITENNNNSDNDQSIRQNNPIDVSVWQQYSSVNYNFSLKFPPDWKTEVKALESKSEILEDKNASIVSFTSPSNSIVKIDPEGKVTKKIDSLPKSTMKITFGGKSATENKYEGGLISVLFNEPENFRIEYEQYNSKDEEVFENMLKTIEFK